MLKIGIMVGSLRKESINRKVAKALAAIGHADVELSFIDIGSLPMFNQDLEESLPAEVTAFKKQVETLDGIIFVSPEYNRSIPAVLKNAIDWATRPYGHNSLADKHAAVVTVSAGSVSGAVAMSHLRSILPFLMNLSGAPEVCLRYTDDMFNAQGELVNDRTREFLKGFMASIAESFKK